MSALAPRPVSVLDEERFEDLFRGYYNRVRGLARRRFRELDAEEIAQETMLRVLTHVDRIDSGRDPWPYIATITMNVGRDLLRSVRPTLELDQERGDAPLAPAADEELLRAELEEWVRSVLGQLTPAGRQVLALRAYGDMSIGQIAAFLGCNDNAVRQKLFRARQQFVRVMDQALVASAAVVSVLGWLFHRPGRRPGGMAVPTTMMLSGAAFTVLAVATLQSVSPFETQVAPWSTTTAAVSRAGAHVQTQSVPAAHPVRVVTTRPANTPGLVSAGPTEVAVATPGSLLKRGQTNYERVVVHTPAGDLRIQNSGRNDGPEGTVCTTARVVTCE